MQRIFVSYRRQDDKHAAGRISDRLVARFGADAVFRDVTGIRDGATFHDRILTSISGADLVLVIIADRWLGASDSEFANRLYDRSDYVLLELEFAQKQGVPILPVLIDDSEMPEPEQLPVSIRALTGVQSARVRDSDFERDVERLIKTIETFEHKKRIDIPPPTMGEPVTGEHLVLRNTSWRMERLDKEHNNERVFGFAVMLDGDPSVLVRVKSVLYLLPPRWGDASPKRIERDVKNFIFKNIAWSDLVVRARVYIEAQGDPVFLSAFVRLTDTGPRFDG